MLLALTTAKSGFKTVPSRCTSFQNGFKTSHLVRLPCDSRSLQVVGTFCFGTLPLSLTLTLTLMLTLNLALALTLALNPGPNPNLNPNPNPNPSPSPNPNPNPCPDLVFVYLCHLLKDIVCFSIQGANTCLYRTRMIQRIVLRDRQVYRSLTIA